MSVHRRTRPARLTEADRHNTDDVEGDSQTSYAIDLHSHLSKTLATAQYANPATEADPQISPATKLHPTTKAERQKGSDTEKDQKSSTASKPDRKASTGRKADRQTGFDSKPDRQTSSATKPDRQTSSATKPDRQKSYATKTDRQTSSATKPDRQTSKPDRQTSSAPKSDQQTSSATKLDRQTNSATKADRQTSSIAKTDRQTSSATEPNRQTSSATKPDRQTSSATKQDRQTCSAAKTDRQTSSATKVNRQTSSVTKSNRQTSSVTKTDRQTSSATKLDRQTSSATKPDRQTSSATKPDRQTSSATKPDRLTSSATKPHRQTCLTTKSDYQTRPATKTDCQPSSTTKLNCQTSPITKSEPQTSFGIRAVSWAASSFKSEPQTSPVCKGAIPTQSVDKNTCLVIKTDPSSPATKEGIETASTTSADLISGKRKAYWTPNSFKQSTATTVVTLDPQIRERLQNEPKTNVVDHSGKKSVMLEQPELVTREGKHQLVKPEHHEVHLTNLAHELVRLVARDKQDDVKAFPCKKLVTVKTEPPEEQIDVAVAAPEVDKRVLVKSEPEARIEMCGISNEKLLRAEWEEERGIFNVPRKTEKHDELNTKISKPPKTLVAVKSERISEDTQGKCEANGGQSNVRARPTMSNTLKTISGKNRLFLEKEASRNAQTEKKNVQGAVQMEINGSDESCRRRNTGPENPVTYNNLNSGSKICAAPKPIIEQMIVKCEPKQGSQCQTEEQTPEKVGPLTNEETSQKFKQLEQIFVTVENEEQKDEKVVVKIELNEKQKTKNEWRSRYQRDSAKRNAVSFSMGSLQQTRQATVTTGSVVLGAAEDTGGRGEEELRLGASELSDQHLPPIPAARHSPELSVALLTTVQEHSLSKSWKSCDVFSSKQASNARPRVTVVDARRLKAEPLKPEGQREGIDKGLEKELARGPVAVVAGYASSEATAGGHGSALSRAGQRAPCANGTAGGNSPSSSQGKEIKQGSHRGKAKVVLQRMNLVVPPDVR